METNFYYDGYNMRSPPARTSTSGIYVNGDKVASLGRSSRSRRGGSHDATYGTDYYGLGTAYESGTGDRRSRHSSSSPKTLLLSRSPKRRDKVRIIQDTSPQNRSKSRDRSDDIAIGPFALANSLGIVNERRRSRDYSSEPRIVETTYRSGSATKSPRRRASADEGLYVYDDSREYRRARRGSIPGRERSIGEATSGRDLKATVAPTENWSTKAEPPYSRYGDDAASRKMRRSATFSGDIPPAVKQLRFEDRDSRRARIDRQNEEINRRRPVPSADRSAPGRGILKHLEDDMAGPSASAPASMHTTPNLGLDTTWALPSSSAYLSARSPKTTWPRSDVGGEIKGKRRDSLGGSLGVMDDENLRRAVEGMNLQQFQMPEQRKWSDELAASRSRDRGDPYRARYSSYRPRDEQGDGYYYVEQERPRGRDKDRRSRRASMPGPAAPVYYEYGAGGDSYRGGSGRDRDGGGGGSRSKKPRWYVFT